MSSGQRIRLGFSLFGMQSLAVEDALRACAEIGYEDIELALMPGFDTDPDVFREPRRRDVSLLLIDLGLRLPALMETLLMDGSEASWASDLRRFKAALCLSRQLVPESPPMIETILGGEVSGWDDLKNVFVDRLGVLAELAQDAQVNFAIKPNRRRALSLPEQGTWLISQVGIPSLKLVFDWSHYDHRGLSMEEALDVTWPNLAFVHLKDSILEAGGDRFTLPGEGKTDYPGLFSLLSRKGYRGSVQVEVSGQIWRKPGYDPLAAARLSFERLAAPLSAAYSLRTP